MPPISSIRVGRSYYPSKQFASAAAEIDPREWSGTIGAGEMLVFGAGGIGGEWVEATNPYGGTQKIPSGYTARNVVITNITDVFADQFEYFAKSAHDVDEGPYRAIVTARGPVYSQGEFDQFVIHNPTATGILTSVQWDHAGTPVSTNAGHPGHGHASMQVGEFLMAGGSTTICPAWKRARRVTAIRLYSKSGIPVAGATLTLKVDNVTIGSATTLSGIATEVIVNVDIPDTDLTNSSVLQAVISSAAQPSGTDLIVELEYEFI